MSTRFEDLVYGHQSTRSSQTHLKEKLSTQREKTTWESIRMDFRLSWKFPVEDALESSLYVKVGSVSNVSEVHATSFRVKVHTMNSHPTPTLKADRSTYLQNVSNTAHFHTQQRPHSKTSIIDTLTGCEGVDVIRHAQKRAVVFYCEHSNKPSELITK
jgi:hypothetical protein